MIETIAIVGAGLAGTTAARALRAQGYSGRIHLIGDEPRHAYDRTTLSKAVLKGEQPEPPAILDAAWYESADLDLQLGRRVSGLDVANRKIQFESGPALAYDRLLLATGARPRRVAIPGSDLAGIHALRDLTDSEALRKALHPGQSLVIVGGGLIGCEVATTARKVGVDVTILEAGDELLLRVLGHRTGSWCRIELERMGVRVARNAQASRFEGEGQVRAVVCADGRQVAADVVLVSIGAEPADQLARAAGIACGRGVLVDATGASSCPEVFAAGDVAAWPLRQGGATLVGDLPEQPDGGRNCRQRHVGRARADAAGAQFLDRDRRPPHSDDWRCRGARRNHPAGRRAGRPPAGAVQGARRSCRSGDGDQCHPGVCRGQPAG